MMKRCVCFAFLLLCALGAWAGNLLFNGSFGLGDAGFALEKELRPDANPGLQFLPLAVDGGLRLDNRYAEWFEIYTKEFTLEPSTTYILSGSFQSSKPGERIDFGVFKVDPVWSAHSHIVTVPGERTPFRYRFTTAAKAGVYHLMIRPGDRKTVSAATLQFSGLRLEKEGDTTADSAEAVMVPEKTLYELAPGAAAKLTLKAANPGPAVYRETIRVTGSDEYTGKVLFQRDFPVELAPGETKEFSFTAPLARYGGIRVTAKGEKLRNHDGFYAVIGKYTAKPVDITRDYVVAFNGGFNYVLDPLSDHPAYRVFNAPFGENMALLGRLGCRIMREHDGGVRGVDWNSVEAERGKFDFSHLDRILSVYEKNHIIMFPVIGDGFIENFQSYRNKNWPDWVKPLSERVKDDPPNCMRQVRGHIQLPPADLYANYIRKTAEHLKGRIPVYEVTNEPNLYLAPEVYVRYLKAAHGAIKAADPAAHVSGFCLTSDFGASSAAWMDVCVKAGGLQYVDSVGFHPYGGRELGSAYPADRYIADLRKLMAAYGKPDMPLWNTELYYLIDQQAKHDAYEETLCQPHHIAWRFLVDLGEGTVQSIAIPANYLWKKMLTPNMFTNWNFHELIPSENFAAYNTLARLFEGAKTVKKQRYPNGLIGYAFRKEGKLIAAVWNYGKRQGVYADFTGFEVMDIFGNPEPAGEKLLGNAPFYLTPGRLTEAEFLAKLEKLPLRLDQPVGAGELARRAGSAVYVMLHNDSASEQAGVAGITGGGLSARNPVRFTIPARGKLSLEIPVKSVVAKGETALMLYVNGSTFRQPLAVVENQAVGKSFQLKNGEGTVEFGGGTITVSMTVRDATDAGPSGERRPWETDCVELFLDVDPLNLPQRHAQAYTPQTFRLFVTPRDAVKLHAQGGVKPGDCKLDVKSDANGYAFTLVIPAETGNVLGFDVKIDDRAGEKMAETTLGTGKELHRNRCNFSLVVKEAAPAASMPSLLRHGDFETGNDFAAYSAADKARFSVVPSPAFFCGEKSLKVMQEADGNAELMTGDLPAEPGKTIEVRFWAKSEAGSVPAQVILDFFRGGHPKHLYKRFPVKLEPEWKEFTFTYEVPTDVAAWTALTEKKTRLRFGLPKSPDAATVYLDNVEYFLR